MVIPEGYAQVNLKWGGTSLPTGAEMTFGVENVADFDADALADKVGDVILATGVEGYWVTTAQISSILVKLGPNDTGPSAELGYVIVGTLSGLPAAPNLAALVIKNTATGGRKGRGRMFQPGMGENHVNVAGILDLAVQVAMQAEWQNVRAGLAAAGIPMVLLHSDATTPSPVTSLAVPQLCATQRRRLRR